MPRNKIRDERTISPFRPKELSGADAVELKRTVESRGWLHALDLMEMCVIEQDTALINCDLGEHEKIVASHAAAKAAWVFFVEFQRRVKSEIGKALLEQEPEPTPAPPKRDTDEL